VAIEILKKKKALELVLLVFNIASEYCIASQKKRLVPS
jgi:hypothetical protein